MLPGGLAGWVRRDHEELSSRGPDRPFDLLGLFVTLDAERHRQGLSWAAFSREVGISAATIRCCAQADDMEADGVLASVRWLDVPPEDLVSSPQRAGDRLTSHGSGMIRADIDAMRAATAGTTPTVAHPGQRTSIQRLTRAAIESGRTIASLTRWSPGDLSSGHCLQHAEHPNTRWRMTPLLPSNAGSMALPEH
jgi:hypothetical protein